MENPHSPLPSLSLLEEHLHSQELKLTDDGIICWKQESTQHPRNWSLRKKAYNASLVMFLDFFITALGIVGAAVIKYARVEYNIGSTVALLAFTSMYFLGQAVGGVVFPPYSESFGRKKLYLISTALFAVFSIMIALARSIVAIFIGRFITGFLSAIPSIISAGSMEDMFDAKARMWLVSVWLISANLSLVVGPIFASYVSFWIGWRWVFHISAAIAALLTLLLLVTKESRASQLLERRIRIIRKATGNQSLQIQNPDHVPDLRTFLRLILLRPLRLLFTEPIVFIVSSISAVAFALVYLFAEVLPIVYGFYGFTDRQTSLVFIAMGTGFLCSIFTRIYDNNLATRRGRLGLSLSPEEKLTGFAIAAPAFAIGLWWFAWTIPPAAPHVPWIVSVLALIPIGFAINEFDCVLVGYLADSYTTYTSSAFASFSLFRSILSAVFPLFARRMYTNLGANYATSLLATIATVACVSPTILIKYGRRIRQASKFARYSLTLESDYRPDNGEAEALLS